MLLDFAKVSYFAFAIPMCGFCSKIQGQRLSWSPAFIPVEGELLEDLDDVRQSGGRGEEEEEDSEECRGVLCPSRTFLP
jgi:hypothetical protein